jgi:hypothetical protein
MLIDCWDKVLKRKLTALKATVCTIKYLFSNSKVSKVLLVRLVKFFVVVEAFLIFNLFGSQANHIIVVKSFHEANPKQKWKLLVFWLDEQKIVIHLRLSLTMIERWFWVEHKQKIFLWDCSIERPAHCEFQTKLK